MINPAPLKERATPGLMTRVALFIIPGLYFVLPAFLFESGLFLLLSPLPLFLLTLKNTSWISLLALVTNSVVLFAFQDKAWIPLAFWLWSIVGVGFPILIKKFGKIVPAAAISFGIGLVVFYMTLTFVSLQDNVGVVEFLKRQIAFNL